MQNLQFPECEQSAVSSRRNLANDGFSGHFSDSLKSSRIIKSHTHLLVARLLFAGSDATGVVRGVFAQGRVRTGFSARIRLIRWYPVVSIVRAVICRKGVGNLVASSPKTIQDTSLQTNKTPKFQLRRRRRSRCHSSVLCLWEWSLDSVISLFLHSCGDSHLTFSVRRASSECSRGSCLLNLNANSGTFGKLHAPVYKWFLLVPSLWP